MPMFRTDNFSLSLGGVLPKLEIAYETYGEMSARKDNVILVAHGITSSHHAAGTSTSDRRRGWWSELIGSGKLFDTTHYCVFSSNTLGSCYGSTGPASTNPETGRPYGAAFPEIRYEDIVRAQHMALASLGVERLVAVAGASIGGFQAFQWGVDFPDFMQGLIVTDTAPKDTFDSGPAANRLIEEFSADPNWNDGDYYATGGIEEALTALRIRVLKSYGFEERLDKIMPEAERAAIVARTAREWAREFDAHGLITLYRALSRYNVEDRLDRVRARLLFILCDTDEWFPASDGPAVMERLRDAGVDATFHEIHSSHGHYATTEEPEKWTPLAGEFLRGLQG